MAGKVKDLLKVAGADKMVEWEKHFGASLYGALLSIIAGILIFAFPGLVTYIVGLYLILRGVIELFRYAKRKALRTLEGIGKEISK